ncbi:dihydroorotase [Haladaptatus sp. F3-133]|uniref:Dihydroorotase n=1 Tax=Halorutilus salinus TaxID=2487751 RepID=A0A9Q4C7T6_9EURY|nr:dihydroorotase [Halorutilus salinus]MCX2819856.1 dihydroorotase [Halorutilus salinus]
MTSVAVVNGRVLHGATREPEDVEIRVENGVVTRIAESVRDGSVDRTVDADGALVLPGAVDAHVHFREPGATQKEDWRSGSRSAVAGGVTTVVDQPNTDPPTVDGAAFDEKRQLASRAVVDHGINAGVTPDWRPDELFDRPVSAYGEVFMADSTGEMGVDASLFERAVRRVGSRGELVTVHAEDSDEFVDVDLDNDDADAWSRHRPPEAEITAVERAVDVADEAVHFAHVSHPRSVDIIDETRHTCEVTPHHLLLSRDDLGELGTYGRMNPPLRSENARRRLFERLIEGAVDCVATDHAPHTAEEKDATVAEAPSGVPGVETVYPLLLALALDDELLLSHVVELVAQAPARILGFGDKGAIREGNDADIAIFDETFETIRDDRLHTRCGWTPFEGFDGVFPRTVLRRGEVVYERDDGDERFAENGGALVV